MVFGLFELFLIYAVIQSTMGSFRIKVGNGRDCFSSSSAGHRSSREIPFSDIAQILAVAPNPADRCKASYSLRLQTEEWRKLTLADMIDSRQEARWVVAQLEKFVGLKLDTHVAVDAGLGTTVRRRNAGRRRPDRSASFRRNSPAAIAIGIAFFLAWTGFVGYRFFSRAHGQSGRVSRPRRRRKASLQPGDLLAAHRLGCAKSANPAGTGSGRRIVGPGDSARSPRARLV